MTFKSLRCSCPKCGSSMALSIELMEYMTEVAENGRDEELEDEIDRMIAGSHAPIHFGDVPFPVAIDTDDGSLCFIGWCPKCKKCGLASITPEHLTEINEEFRGEDDGQEIKPPP